MKKVIALMIVMMLILSGCGAQESDPQDAPAAPEQTSSAEAESQEPADTTEESAAEQEQADTSEESTDNLAESQATTETENTEKENTMQLLIGETEVPVTWEDNASVKELKALKPITIQMSMYGGFEQVGSIGQSIVRNDKQTSTSCGDIVLYSGNQIVIFYGSNSWAYTRLGHVDLSQEEMSELLANGDVTITLK